MPSGRAGNGGGLLARLLPSFGSLLHSMRVILIPIVKRSEQPKIIQRMMTICVPAVKATVAPSVDRNWRAGAAWEMDTAAANESATVSQSSQAAIFARRCRTLRAGARRRPAQGAS
jgi:hypothetical protein